MHFEQTADSDAVSAYQIFSVQLGLLLTIL